MTAQIVQLQETNFRDPVATLRVIADEIESGKHGEVGCVALVIMGDTTEVFGMGVDSEAPSVATLLYAGFLKLIQPMVDHGQ